LRLTGIGCVVEDESKERTQCVFQIRSKYLFKNNLGFCGRGVHLIPHSQREAIFYQV
jgi:hypothetical protein